MIDRGYRCDVCGWPADTVHGACEQCWTDRLAHLSRPATETDYPTGALRDRMRTEAAKAVAEFEAADEARS